MRALERRAGLLGILRSALEERSVFLLIGDENPAPELRSVQRGRRQLRARLPEPGDGGRGRAAAHGLRDGDRLGARRRGTSCPASSRRSTSARRCSATTTRSSASDAGSRRRGNQEGLPELARELHPDVNRHDPEAEEKFKEAAEAYEVLSDPDRRSTYDTFGHDGLRSGGWAPHRRLRQLRGRAVGVLRPRRPAVQRAVRVRPRGRRAAATSRRRSR